MKYYYDLHIHSILSPCGDNDMTPNNIVNMSKLCGLDIIALSDHNTCGNVEATAVAAKNCGVIFIPGMELETAEEIHVLCLFENVESALAFEKEVVAPALPPVKNNERIFGKQVLMDSDDNELGTDDRYLINATSITIDDAALLVKKYNGVAIPAHIDKQIKSVISVFGMVDESMGYDVFELSKNAPEDFTATQFSLKDANYSYIHNSDAHYLCDISDGDGENYLEFNEKPTPKDVINALKCTKRMN